MFVAQSLMYLCLQKDLQAVGLFLETIPKRAPKTNVTLENCIWPTLSPSWLLSYPSSDFTPCSFPAQQIKAQMFTGLSDNMPSPRGQSVRLYHTVEPNSPSKRMTDIYVFWLFICSWAIILLISQHLSLPAASIVTGNLLGSPSCSAAVVGTLFYCGCRSWRV